MLDYRKVSSDLALTARMRFHQSFFREQVLRVPAGPGPTRHSKFVLGNMLRWEDGQRGLNFLTPKIFIHAQARMSETGAIEPFRLLCNMLSSQPMCFNLFAPLIDDEPLARAVVAAVTGAGVDSVTRVAIEYAPEPAQDYLNDRTAFDAFIEYIAQGERAFIGIETKLTEPFSPKVYPAEHPGYAHWLEAVHSPFVKKDWPTLTASRCNQLWRDHLLVVAMLNRPSSPYARGMLLVVHHPLDQACAATAAFYAQHLDPLRPMLRVMHLGQVLQSLRSLATPIQQPWLKAFEQRYLDLTFSETAWQQCP